MTDVNRPLPSELPTSGQLVKSTAIAAGVAAVLLVTVVMPAEYGIDPTRIGSVFGLTDMGKLKRQLAAEAEADAAMDAKLKAGGLAPASPAASPTPPAADAAPPATAATPVEAQAPAKTVEQPAPEPAPAAAAKAPAAAKPAAQPGARTDETIFTLEPNQATEIKLVMQEGDSVRFSWSSSGGKVNFDTHADAAGIDYHGYGKGSSQREEGVLTAAFTGNHGWFWRNRSGETVTMTLKTNGAYSQIKR